MKILLLKKSSMNVDIANAIERNSSVPVTELLYSFPILERIKRSATNDSESENPIIFLLFILF